MICEEAVCLNRPLSEVTGCTVLATKSIFFKTSAQERSRGTVSALCFHICCSIGRRNISTSRAAFEMTLKAPHVVLTALEQAYITYGRVVPSYFLRMSGKLTPNVELRRQLSTFIVFIASCLVSPTFSFHYSFVSIVNPKYLHIVFRFTSPLVMSAMNKCSDFFPRNTT